MSDMGPDAKGITFSLSFRCVQAQEGVNEDGTLSNPRPLKPKTAAKFEAARVKAEEPDEKKIYEAKRKELDQRMKSFFNKLCS